MPLNMQDRNTNLNSKKEKSKKAAAEFLNSPLDDLTRISERVENREPCLASACSGQTGLKTNVSMADVIDILKNHLATFVKSNSNSINSINSSRERKNYITKRNKNNENDDDKNDYDKNDDDDDDDDGDKNNYLWIHIVGPSFHEMADLASIISIHPSTAVDILSEKGSGRDRAVRYDDYFHIVTHELIEVDGYLDVQLLHILRFDTFVISVQMYTDIGPKNAILDKYGISLKRNDDEKDNRMDTVKIVFKMLGKMKYRIRFPEWVIFSLLSANLSYYHNKVEMIEIEIDTIKDLLVIIGTGGSSEEIHRRMRVAGARISFLYWFMHAKHDMLIATQNYIANESSEISSDLILYLRHISDSIISMRYSLQLSKESLQDSQDTYLNMVSSENEKSSDKVDAAMMRLSIVATIMLPLTVVSTLFGMNMPIPGGGTVQHDENLKAWDIFMIVMIAYIAFVLGVMKYKKMI